MTKAEHLVEVLRRHDLRELGQARQAEAPVPERLGKSREALKELRGAHPVERRRLREPQLSAQVVEERGVPGVHP